MDKSVVLTDEVIDSLMDDWFSRDGETYVHKRTKGRLGWESSLKTSSYSEFILASPTKEDLIKRAYSLAKDTLCVMDFPFSVNLCIGGDKSFSTGKRFVKVATDMFDDEDLSVGERLDTFLGLTIHEGCHLLYTEFSELTSISKVVHHIFNIIEDERIERLLGERRPGLANFLEKSKYYYFDKFYLDVIYPKNKEKKESPFQRIMSLLLYIIRYPKYLEENDFIEFAYYLLDIKKILTPFPADTKQSVMAADQIFEVIKELYIDEAKKEKHKRKKSKETSDKDKSSEPRSHSDSDDLDELSDEDDSDYGESSESFGETKISKRSKSDSESDSDEDEDDDSVEEPTDEGESDKTEDSDSEEESTKRDEEKGEDADEGEDDFSSEELSDDEIADAIKKMAEDYSEISSKLSELLDSTTESGLPKEKESSEVKKCDELLAEICEGTCVRGTERDSFFVKAENNQTRYKFAYDKIVRYVPAIQKVVKGHCREYRLIHRSMRSGLLDSSKLAEAYQGVPNVYIREGEVKSDRVALCILIDESGSMSGDRIQSAREMAVLMNEAFSKVPQVDLFIYGHSGDMRTSVSTDLFIYREHGYYPKYSLGSVGARGQNRDGTAIVEVAKRVRRQTSEKVLMFVLSDGTPCAGGYSGSSAINHTKNCVLKVEKMGFDVVQVCINACYNPASMFKHFVTFTDMSTFPKELGKVIKKAIMSNVKSRVL